MEAAVIDVALLGLLLFGLGLAVSATRGRTGVNIGSSSDPTDRLHKLVRAHGNTAEYAPMFAILFLLIGERNPAKWVTFTMGLAVVSRYLIAGGLILNPSLDKPYALRFIGAVGTYITGIVLSIVAFTAL